MKKRIEMLKADFAAVLNVKEEYKKELGRIEADTAHSENYKLEKRLESEEVARGKLEEIFSRAEKCIGELESVINGADKAFDYASPRLAGAVTFITANGTNTPLEACEAMINDFVGHPKELAFLASLFERNGLTAAAVSASEAASVSAAKATLPQRLSDYLFYSSKAAPDSEVDFTGFMEELDVLAEGGNEP